MICLRFSVISIDAQITSIFFACSAGMMPSQATGTSSHCAFISAHTASMRSISKPTHFPEASLLANGG